MCNNCGCNVRSCSTTYTNSNQTVAEAVTTLSILGGEVTSTGKCINAQASGFNVKASGLYRIGFDVTLNPTAAGTAVIQMTKDGVAMPEAVATVTTVANALITVHVETRDTLLFRVSLTVRHMVSFLPVSPEQSHM